MSCNNRTYSTQMLCMSNINNSVKLNANYELQYNPEYEQQYNSDIINDCNLTEEGYNNNFFDEYYNNEEFVEKYYNNEELVEKYCIDNSMTKKRKIINETIIKNTNKKIKSPIIIENENIKKINQFLNEPTNIDLINITELCNYLIENHTKIVISKIQNSKYVDWFKKFDELQKFIDKYGYVPTTKFNNVRRINLFSVAWILEQYKSSDILIKEIWKTYDNLKSELFVFFKRSKIYKDVFDIPKENNKKTPISNMLKQNNDNNETITQPIDNNETITQPINNNEIFKQNVDNNDSIQQNNDNNEIIKQNIKKVKNIKTAKEPKKNNKTIEHSENIIGKTLKQPKKIIDKTLKQPKKIIDKTLKQQNIIDTTLERQNIIDTTLEQQKENQNNTSENQNTIVRHKMQSIKPKYCRNSNNPLFNIDYIILKIKDIFNQYPNITFYDNYFTTKKIHALNYCCKLKSGIMKDEYSRTKWHEFIEGDFIKNYKIKHRMHKYVYNKKIPKIIINPLSSYDHILDENGKIIVKPKKNNIVSDDIDFNNKISKICDENLKSSDNFNLDFIMECDTNIKNSISSFL